MTTMIEAHGHHPVSNFRVTLRFFDPSVSTDSPSWPKYIEFYYDDEGRPVEPDKQPKTVQMLGTFDGNAHFNIRLDFLKQNGWFFDPMITYSPLTEIPKLDSMDS
jgi:hypothetical protein